MPLLIDGHNLIGRLHDLSLSDLNDEIRLVTRLKTYAARGGKHITVVFDRGMPGGHSDNLSSGRVEVVFSAAGHTADGILRERVRRSRNPRGLIVVTSDREVIAVAQARGARVMRSEEFAERLERPRPAEGSAREDIHLSEEEVEEWLDIFGVKE